MLFMYALGAQRFVVLLGISHQCVSLIAAGTLLYDAA